MTLQLVLSQGGPWASLVGVGALLLTGRLVPRSALRDRERLVELYRDAFEREHKAREIADKQLGEMLEYGRTANHVLAALPASPAAPDGDQHATPVA
jgi:hypothetical protein